MKMEGNNSTFIVKATGMHFSYKKQAGIIVFRFIIVTNEDGRDLSNSTFIVKATAGMPFSYKK